MPIDFYMDHRVLRAIRLGLRLRGVVMLTAYENRASELADVTLLDRDGELGRVLCIRADAAHLRLAAELRPLGRSGCWCHDAVGGMGKR
jgi:hypothetical protein